MIKRGILFGIILMIVILILININLISSANLTLSPSSAICYSPLDTVTTFNCLDNITNYNDNSDAPIKTQSGGVSGWVNTTWTTLLDSNIPINSVFTNLSLKVSDSGKQYWNVQFYNSSSGLWINVTNCDYVFSSSNVYENKTCNLTDYAKTVSDINSLKLRVYAYNLGGSKYQYEDYQNLIINYDPAVIISSCGQNINASGSYLLNQSITSTSDCLTINLSNVQIDCAGNTITYGTAGTASSFGISASATTSQVNLTIKNCIIIKPSALGASGRGISLTRFANSTIVNNTIMTNGTSSNMGIYIITGSDGNNISRNTIVTSGSAATNYGISLNAGSADTIVEYNNITTGTGTATTDNYGIYATDPRANISSNIIRTFGSGDSNYGIYSTAATGTRIVNNTIYASGTTGNNRGIYLYNSNSNLIANNTINTTGQASPGIYLSASGSANILNNQINSTADSIYMTSATLSDFTSANISRDNTRFGRNITVYGGGGLTLPCPNNTIINNPADGALKFFGCNNITVQNWYRPNRDTDGLLFVNSDNNTIINNTINGGIEGLDMVNTAGMCDNNLIADNTFSSFGYIEAYGTYAIHIYGTYNVIIGNNLSTSGVTSGNNAINIQNDFNNITNNIITTNGTSGNIGINLESGAINNLIQNNTITTSGTSGNTGIYFVSTCTGNIIRNNTITATGTTSGNLGMRLVTNSNNNIIEYNTFYTKGLTSGNNGIDLSSSSNNIFRFNNVYAGYGTGTTDNDAISSVSSKNNTFTSNILFANGTATSITSSSIFLQSNSANNTFTNNIITKSVGNAIELDFSGTYPSGNTFQNNSLNDVGGSDLFFLDAKINGTSLIDQPIGRYNFTGIGGTISVENTQFGKIAFVSPVNGSGNNMSNDIQIRFNFVEVAEGLKGLNATANISFYNLPTNFFNPKIKRDGIYECNAMTVPACVNFTSLNAGNVSFNVTGWSNYSILDPDDIISPSFSNYFENPVNNSPYSQGQIYRFNITINETNPGRVWIEFNGVNYTNGNVSNVLSVYMFNRSDLSAGTYNYTWWANDTYGNTNSSSVRYYSISKGENTLTLTNSAGWAPINYGTETIFSCSAVNGVPNLYISNTEVTNPITTVLGVGSYNIKCNISENQNYSAGISQGTLTVNKASSKTSLVFDKTSPQIFGTLITPTCSVISGVGTPVLTMSGNVITSGVALNLSAGNYNFNCSLNSSQNYSYSENISSFTINQISANTTLITTPISPITYGNASNFSCSNSADLQTILYINGVDESSEKGLNIVRSAGNYSVNCSSIGNQNYSGSSSQENYMIDKIGGDIRLYLNSNEDNLTIDYPEQYNITATTLYGGVLIYKDGVDVTVDNGLNVTPSRNSGYYNITAVSSGDENHSSMSIARWLNVTLDETHPAIELASPQEGGSYGYNTSLSLNYSVIDEHLDSCWYNLNNGNNISIANCQNTTFNASADGSYILYLYANDSLGNLAIKNASFFILVGAPTIILTSPIGVYLNTHNITFRYVPSDLDLGSCELWGDFDGVFKLNQTNNIPLNSMENVFDLTLPDGIYRWNIGCNDSLGHLAFNGNKTFYVDNIAPVIDISEPKGTKNSWTGIPLTFSINDASPVNCKYSVSWATGGNVISNTSINCISTLFNLSSVGDYVINLFVTDLAENTNFSTSSFTVSTSVNPPSGGGGGGGGGGGIITPNATKQSGQISLSKIDSIMAYSGDKKTLSLTAKNSGKIFLNHCMLVSSGDISNWLYSKQVQGIAPGENVNFIFDLNIPEETKSGDYSLGLEVDCDEVNQSQNLGITIPGGSQGIQIKEIKQNGNLLNITYDFNGSNSIAETKMELWIVDENNIEVKRINDNFIADKGINERQILMELPNGLVGIYTFYLADSSDLSNPVKQSVVLGKSSSAGFTILDQPGNKMIAYAVFLIIIGAGIFFIMWRGGKKKEVHKKVKVIDKGLKKYTIKNDDEDEGDDE